MNVLSAFQSVSGWFSNGIEGLFSRILYVLESGLVWVVGIMDECFSVMSGITKVRYQGETKTLLDVFFGNTIVEKIYWAMALLGILLCFVFAIIAVAKKAVDSGDKMKQSMGDILTGTLKAILIIVSLTFIFNAVLSLSDKLFTQINYAFNHADTLGKEDTIEFTDEQYATMARVLETVANYSLMPSYNSRYNLNSCYNEIRGDLQSLEQEGVFDFYYVSEDGTTSWQAALQGIVNAGDLSQDLRFDTYNTEISNALLKCMKTMQTDSSFAPLRSYTRQIITSSYNAPLDRMVFLMCTMRAARNPVYNQNASMDDPLRSAYYMGEKSIYNYTDVTGDFDIANFDHILLLMVSFKLIWDLAVIIFDCVARIFNMIFLYLIAPPFIGVMPLDEGGKFKQWTTAFVVQCFGVFGTVIAMRVLLIFIPIISSSDLVLFDNSLLNQVGKFVLILGGMATAKRASGVITGILADNAGYQAVNASNMGESVRHTMDHLRNRITGYGDVGNLRKNDLGLRSMFGGKKDGGAQEQGRGYPGGGKDSGPSGDTSATGGGTSTRSSAPTEPAKFTNSTQPQTTEPTKVTNPTQPAGNESQNPAPEIPEAPPMPYYDTSNPPPEAPDVPAMPHWDSEQRRQMPTIPEAPPAPHWDEEQKRQVATAPEVPPMAPSLPKLRPVPPPRYNNNSNSNGN